MNLVINSKVIKTIYTAKSMNILRWSSNKDYILITWDNMTFRLYNYDRKLESILSSVQAPCDFKTLYETYMSMFKNVISRSDTFEDFHLVEPSKKIYGYEGPNKEVFFFSGRLIPGPLRKSRYYYLIWKTKGYHGMYIVEGNADHEEGVPVFLVMGAKFK